MTTREKNEFYEDILPSILIDPIYLKDKLLRYKQTYNFIIDDFYMVNTFNLMLKDEYKIIIVNNDENGTDNKGVENIKYFMNDILNYCDNNQHYLYTLVKEKLINMFSKYFKKYKINKLDKLDNKIKRININYLIYLNYYLLNNYK